MYLGELLATLPSYETGQGSYTVERSLRLKEDSLWVLIVDKRFVPSLRDIADRPATASFMSAESSL
jgi:hypothetical protein